MVMARFIVESEAKIPKLKLMCLTNMLENKHGPSQQRHRLMILSTKTIWVMYHPRGAFYAPDYPTWKQDGLTPVYREPTVEDLTDEEILCLWDWWSGEDLATNVLDFADTYRRALLGEAGLVKWHQAYVKKMNEQDPAWKATEQYECNGFCGEYEGLSRK
jgi:hypothetical protein